MIATTLGLMGGALLSGSIGTGSGGGGIGACGLGGGSATAAAFPPAGGVLAAGGPVRVTMDCGDLAIAPGSSGAWSIDGSSPGGRAPSIAEDGGLTIRTPERPGISLGEAASAWTLTLPAGAPLDLGVTLNAGSARLGLGGLDVQALALTVNAGDARVDMREVVGTGTVNGTVNAGSLRIALPARSATGSITVNAGAASICRAPGTGLLIHGGTALGGTNYAERGLVQSGDDWQTPGYDTADGRIELTVKVNLGSVTLDPEDGCD
ncbi:MAG: hypothetical protein WCK58_11595 [Chloroflexota bacterium]